MQRVFGLPVGALTATLTVLLAASAGALVALGTRNRVMVRLGLRNIRRRRGRTALIVVGLMLATTIIATALGTGDTMAATIRSSVFEQLGGTDELVTIKGTGIGIADPYNAGGATGGDYFPQRDATAIENAASTRPDLIDGAAPAIIDSVAVQDVTRRSTEPRVTLFASSTRLPSAFGSIKGRRGAGVALGDLRAGETYLNRDGARALDAEVGDTLRVYATGREATLRVRDIVSFQGAGTTAAGIMLPLPAAQALLGQAGRVRYVMISNRGSASSGAGRTEAVRTFLAPTASRLGLEVDETKHDQLEIADDIGNTFMQMFTTFGSFSIAAGIVLIFLIFVMLAAERRGEMGVARAIGTRRGHLVQTFLFEGAAYDVVAAAVGALLGLGFSLVTVLAIGRLFASEGFDLAFKFQPRSLVLAYVMGVLLTLVVVGASAWRVSRLNIVTAIRDLPEPPDQRKRRLPRARAFLLIAIGAVLTASGRQSHAALTFLLGVSLILLGLVPVLRLFRVKDRIAYTITGLALVVWWLLPFRVYEAMVPELRMDFSVWIVGGLMVVLGITWVVMNNADAVLGFGAAVLGRIRSLVPVLRVSMAYPLRNRLRSGMTLAMFTLVVFTIVVGATTSGSFINSFNDVKRFGGGFDVRASSSPLSPVSDMAGAVAKIPGVAPGTVRAVGAQSTVAVRARQLGTSRELEDYVVRGLDRGFLDTTTYGFAATARGFGSGQQIWEALRDHPGLAVVDAFVAPRRQNWGFGIPQKFRLSGFWIDDGVFDPLRVEIVDPATGKSTTVTIIGVIRSDAPTDWAGIMTSQRTLASFGARAIPTVHYLKLAPGADAAELAHQLESRLLANGLQAETFSSLLHKAMAGSFTFNWLILGFMGLGLVVGIAALGVISARSVVERRQQIGVLRAIGFQPRMVQIGFLAESAFFAVTAIVLGIALGLIEANNVLTDAARKQDWAAVRLHMPWPVLAVVVVGVLGAALLTTLLPARHASKVSAAEALRYQ